MNLLFTWEATKYDTVFFKYTVKLHWQNEPAQVGENLRILTIVVYYILSWQRKEIPKVYLEQTRLYIDNDYEHTPMLSSKHSHTAYRQSNITIYCHWPHHEHQLPPLRPQGMFCRPRSFRLWCQPWLLKWPCKWLWCFQPKFPVQCHLQQYLRWLPNQDRARHRHRIQQSICNVNNLVTGAIAAAHAGISGEPQLLPTIITPSTASYVEPTQLFHSASLAIDSWVLAKLKGKIWDPGSLLSNSANGNDKYQLSFLSSNGGLPASLCLEPASKPNANLVPRIFLWERPWLRLVTCLIKNLAPEGVWGKYQITSTCLQCDIR
jgi:hypothetical protein